MRENVNDMLIVLAHNLVTFQHFFHFLFYSQEQEVLNKLFDKYVHSSIDMIVDGIVDGKQGQRLKTVVPQTDLNMVG